MGRHKKYTAQIHTCISGEVIERIEAIADVMGIKRNEVIRRLLESAVPDIDKNDRFWSICKTNGIFKMSLPDNTIVPMIAGLFDLEITGKNQIDGKPIKLNPASGLSPLLWALLSVKELFFDKEE